MTQQASTHPYLILVICVSNKIAFILILHIVRPLPSRHHYALAVNRRDEAVVPTVEHKPLLRLIGQVLGLWKG